MDPVPPIADIPRPEDSTPSSGPFSQQRQKAIRMRRRVNQKKIQQANQTPQTVDGTGQPENDS